MYNIMYTLGHVSNTLETLGLDLYDFCQDPKVSLVLQILSQSLLYYNVLLVVLLTYNSKKIISKIL